MSDLPSIPQWDGHDPVSLLLCFEDLARLSSWISDPPSCPSREPAATTPQGVFSRSLLVNDSLFSSGNIAALKNSLYPQLFEIKTPVRKT